MTPASLDLTLYIGIDFGPVTFIAQDQNGNVVDLTNWEPFAEVRKSKAAEAARILDLAPSITSAVNGAIVISKTIAQIAAANLAIGEHQWDLVLKNPDGKRLGPFLAGKFSVKRTVTQPAA